MPCREQNFTIIFVAILCQSCHSDRVPRKVSGRALSNNLIGKATDMAHVFEGSSSTGLSSSEFLAELSDPNSGVVTLPNRSRPKRRRHASRLLARDLALMPAVTRDAPAIRTIQSKPALRRSNTRKTPFVAYLSTVAVALAIGTAVGFSAVNGWLPGAESVAKILIQPADLAI